MKIFIKIPTPHHGTFPNRDLEPAIILTSSFKINCHGGCYPRAETFPTTAYKVFAGTDAMVRVIFMWFCCPAGVNTKRKMTCLKKQRRPLGYLYQAINNAINL